MLKTVDNIAIRMIRNDRKGKTTPPNPSCYMNSHMEGLYNVYIHIYYIFHHISPHFTMFPHIFMAYLSMNFLQLLSQTVLPTLRGQGLWRLPRFRTTTQDVKAAWNLPRRRGKDVSIYIQIPRDPCMLYLHYMKGLIFMANVG